MTNSDRHNTSKPQRWLSNMKIVIAPENTPIIEERDTILDKANTIKNTIAGDRNENT